MVTQIFVRSSFIGIMDKIRYSFCCKLIFTTIKLNITNYFILNLFPKNETRRIEQWFKNNILD